MKQFLIGYWADWPKLNSNGDVGYTRCHGLLMEDTNMIGNSMRPAAWGWYYRCTECGETYQVPSCIFTDEYFVPHFHDQEEIEVEGRILSKKNIANFADLMRKAMANMVENHVSLLSAFSER